MRTMASPVLATLQEAGTAAAEPYRGWEGGHRPRLVWDRVAWVSHCVDCYPGNCPFRVYVKDGLVLYEEPGATYQEIEPGVPDHNPMGCQKGAMWGQMLYSTEPLLYPLKRAGERGSGKWKRVSWDPALSDGADGVLAAIPY